jgi:hypothetical protein
VNPTYVYEVYPRKDKRGVDLISHMLPFGCGTANQTQSSMLSATRNTAAAHMML